MSDEVQFQCMELAILFPPKNPTMDLCDIDFYYRMYCVLTTMVLAHPFGEKCTVSIKQWRSYAPPPPIPCCQAEQGLAGTQDLPLSPISPRLPQPAPLARAVSACLDLLCSYCAHFPLFHGFGSNMCHYRIFCACFPQMLQEDHFSLKSVCFNPSSSCPLIACLPVLTAYNPQSAPDFDMPLQLWQLLAFHRCCKRPLWPRYIFARGPSDQDYIFLQKAPLTKIYLCNRPLWQRYIIVRGPSLTQIIYLCIFARGPFDPDISFSCPKPPLCPGPVSLHLTSTSSQTVSVQDMHHTCDNIEICRKRGGCSRE